MSTQGIESQLYYISLGKTPATIPVSAPDRQKTSGWPSLVPSTMAAQIQGTEIRLTVPSLFVEGSSSGGRGKRITQKALVRIFFSNAAPSMHQLQRPSGVADIVFQEW